LQVPNTTTLAQIQLPKLELATFYGDSLQWTPYWDAFQAAFGMQDIPPVQKFQYLLSTLKNVAHKAVDGIPITNENYQLAVEILQKRFGDINTIKRTLYAELRNIPFATNKISDLRRCTESVNRIIRQLESIGENMEHPILVTIILEKLPSTVLQKLGDYKTPGELWKIVELQKHLETYISIREESYQILQGSRSGQLDDNMQRNDQKQMPQRNTKTKTFGAVVSKSTISKNVSKSKGLYPCAFCDGDHLNDQCSVYASLAQRKQRISEKRLCYRCLRPGHFSNQCYFDRPCSHCNGNHNRALCNKNLAHDELNQSTVQFEISTSHPLSSKNEVKTATSNTVTVVDSPISAEIVKKVENIESVELNASITQKDNVALLSTKVTVFKIENDKQPSKKVEAFVFLDSGSQRTYITNDLKEKLKLPVKNHQVLSIGTFASKTPQKIHSSLVDLGIQLKNGEIKTIQANAVPFLTQSLKTASISQDDLAIAINLYPDLSSSEISNNTILKPDILIGMDLFWDFFDQVMPLKLPSGLTAVTSKIGIMFSENK